MSNYHYRIIVDFSHPRYEPDVIENLFAELAEGIFKVLDPHEGDDEAPDREVYITGIDVTAEYDLHDELEVHHFKESLKDSEAVQKFFQDNVSDE